MLRKKYFFRVLKIEILKFKVEIEFWQVREYRESPEGAIKGCFIKYDTSLMNTYRPPGKLSNRNL
jgi:hypothetical protein